ncbi:MAG TPA: hypothetical protein VM782_01670, partial [Stellaceae bacterium]|nr:hypothetical protein [Stellaceae bacterium]
GEDPDSLIATAGAPTFAELLRAARPLAEVLWHSELGAKSVTTPERRADLEHRLMAHAGTIGDRAVQAEYRRFLRDKLFTLGRPKFLAKAGRSSRAPAAPLAAPRSEAPPPPPSPGRRQRELLVGMLLEHPFLIAEAHEEIAFFDFPEAELDSLRRAILEADTRSEGLDVEALRQHLGQNGFAEAVDAVLAVLTEHGGFLTRVADAESVRQGWTHVVQMVRVGNYGELVEFEDSPPPDLSPEEWQSRYGWEATEYLVEDELSPGKIRRSSRSPANLR